MMVREVTRHWLDRLGIPGVFGIGLMVCAIVAVVSGLYPLVAATRTMERQADTLRSGSGRGSAAISSQEEHSSAMTSVLAAVPVETMLPATLADIHQSSHKHGVVLERGSFERIVEPGRRLTRHTLNFHSMATYPALRQFLRETLESQPFLALEELTLVPKSGDPARLEARLRFSLLMRHLDAAH